MASYTRCTWRRSDITGRPGASPHRWGKIESKIRFSNFPHSLNLPNYSTSSSTSFLNSNFPTFQSGLGRRDLAFGMGDGEGAFPESRHGAAAGGKSGERRRGTRVDVYQCLLGDVSSVHHAAGSAGAVVVEVRCPRWRIRRPDRWTTSKDSGSGASRMVGRLSWRLEVAAEPPLAQPSPRLHASTTSWLGTRAQGKASFAQVSAWRSNRWAKNYSFYKIPLYFTLSIFHILKE